MELRLVLEQVLSGVDPDLILEDRYVSAVEKFLKTEPYRKDFNKKKNPAFDKVKSEVLSKVDSSMGRIRDALQSKRRGAKIIDPISSKYLRGRLKDISQKKEFTLGTWRKKLKSVPWTREALRLTDPLTKEAKLGMRWN